MAQWRKQARDEVYTDDEIAARLAEELPQWTHEGGWIRRKYKTSGWKGTLMVVNTVGHLAEAAWHHPDLTVSYAFVSASLTWFAFCPNAGRSSFGSVPSCFRRAVNLPFAPR